MPTGGVTRPIQRFSAMMTPKWTVDMPRVLISGSRIGASMTMAALASMTMPTMISRKLIRSRITILLLVIARKPSRIAWGSFAATTTQLPAFANPTSSRMVAAVMPASVHRPRTSLTLKSL